MAEVNRSVNRELDEGMTDGTYKKVVQNRGGIVEAATWLARKNLSVKLYGVVEAPRKMLPDGSGTVETPYTVETPNPEALGY